jgi:hypothetical protein
VGLAASNNTGFLRLLPAKSVHRSGADLQTSFHVYILDADWRRLTLKLEEITRLSRDVAEEYAPHLDVIGVASTGGSTARVELLVTIAGCHKEPCVLMLNVNRGASAMFERELRAKLREALAPTSIPERRRKIAILPSPVTRVGPSRRRTDPPGSGIPCAA